jgi:hypothetical protein
MFNSLKTFGNRCYADFKLDGEAPQFTLVGQHRIKATREFRVCMDSALNRPRRIVKPQRYHLFAIRSICKLKHFAS